MDEVSVEKRWIEICTRRNGRNPEEYLPRPRFVHFEIHMDYGYADSGPQRRGVRRACATEPPFENTNE